MRLAIALLLPAKMPVYEFLLDTYASIHWLMVSNMCYFPFHIWNVILPIDFHILQRGRYTTNQMPLKFPLDPIRPPVNAIKPPFFWKMMYPHDIPI